MKRALLFPSIAAAVFAIGPARHVDTFHHENVLGTSLELKVASASPEDSQRAESAVLAEIDRLSAILSGYRADSEFSQWARSSARPVPVSPELFEVLALWDRWRERTGGALNPAIETASRLWKQAVAEGRLPSADQRARAVAAMAGPHWKLDPEARAATRIGAASLMLNSFTKSWIIDRAARAGLRAARVDGLVLDIGGDIAAFGTIAETVAVADPFDAADNADSLGRVLLRDRAVATSGNYRRGFDIGGRHYSHILDPRTAMPVEAIMSATVIAEDPATAGALATAFNVLAPAESEELAAKFAGTEYLLIAGDGRRYTSRNWGALFLPQAAAAVGPANVRIALELARIGDARYRRPYVAVWIEDKDRFPVRTLALWYEKPCWLPDLKAWSRSDRLRAMAEGNEIASSVSSATRPPGKYTLSWDGKDQAGKAVKPGKYTVYIEAAREHGSYQLMRQEVDLAGSAQSFTIPGNTEVAGATVALEKAR